MKVAFCFLVFLVFGAYSVNLRAHPSKKYSDYGLMEHSDEQVEEQEAQLVDLQKKFGFSDQELKAAKLELGDICKSIKTGMVKVLGLVQTEQFKTVCEKVLPDSLPMEQVLTVVDHCDGNFATPELDVLCVPNLKEHLHEQSGLFKDLKINPASVWTRFLPQAHDKNFIEQEPYDSKPNGRGILSKDDNDLGEKLKSEGFSLSPRTRLPSGDYVENVAFFWSQMIGDGFISSTRTAARKKLYGQLEEIAQERKWAEKLAKKEQKTQEREEMARQLERGALREILEANFYTYHLDDPAENQRNLNTIRANREAQRRPYLISGAVLSRIQHSTDWLLQANGDYFVFLEASDAKTDVLKLFFSMEVFDYCPK